MKKEIKDTLEHANRKLALITEDGFPVRFEDVELRIDASEGGLAVYSGTEFLAYVNDAMVSKAIWGVVDRTRAQVKSLTGEDAIAEDREPEAKAKPADGAIDTIDGVMAEVDRILATANAKLSEITNGNFPFSYQEVQMTARKDCAGIYVHSGSTPVAAVARTGDPNMVVTEIRDAVFSMVDATRAAVERRGNLHREAEALKAEGDVMELATKTMADKGIDPSLVLREGVNHDAAKAVTEAARKAILKANQNPFLGTIRSKDWRFSMRVLPMGLVILMAGKECMVTRFPKIGNNKTIASMVSFMENDIAAMSASRNAYFKRVCMDTDKEESLHDLARQIDAAEAALRAVAVM